MTDGPIEKFRLIKLSGKALREAGYDPRTMSCAELREAISALGYLVTQ